MSIFKQVNIVKNQPTLILLAILLSLIIPRTLNAGVVITEIMYDLPGADAGREWIEVYNTNDFDVDLSQYRFFRNNVNHRIGIYDPDEADLPHTLPSGQYAVIADGPPNFLVDNPDFSGILYNSSFTLRDGGEKLSIVNPDGDIVYSVHYEPEWGARATGNSLQFNGDEWIPAVPTPGEPNATEAADESDDSGDLGQFGQSGGNNQNGNQNDSQDNTDQPESSHSGQNLLSNLIRPTELKAGSGRIRYGIVNSPISFQAISNIDMISVSDDETSLFRNSARFQWSFGDAGSNQGENATHTYYHEGEYNLILNVDYLSHSATSRNKVIIRQPIVDISLKTGRELVDIMLENHSDFEVNFGLFFFKSYQIGEIEGEKQAIVSKDRFVIPQDTILNANSSLRIAGEISNLKINDGEGIVMYYPNGKVAANFINLADSNRSFLLSGIEKTDNLFQVIRSISDPSRHNELEIIFNVFKNRIKQENRL